MTIAIAIKVNDGVVVAADSASSLSIEMPNGDSGIAQVYNSGNKLFNLRKGLPIGTAVWGLGNIGTKSMELLMKELRQRFSKPSDDYSDWEIDPDNYELSSVASRVHQFLVDEKLAEWKKAGFSGDCSFGVFICGYSTGSDRPEVFILETDKDGTCAGARPVEPDEEASLQWNGQRDAIHRLIFGLGTEAPAVLEKSLGVPEDQIDQVMDILKFWMQDPLVSAAMPIQEAIDLAEFLAHLSVQYSRFRFGPNTVGGPIDIAAITRYEGFKWIKRKYYYDRRLNPEEVAG